MNPVLVNKPPQLGHKLASSLAKLYATGELIARSFAQGSFMKARVTVTLKPSVLDPQGKAIEGALHALAVPGIKGVRQGKVFEIELADMTPDAATAALKVAAEKLLANLIVETYRIELV